MNIKIIASSSKGNAYKISHNESSLLIECGIAIKKLKKAFDYKLSEVLGCLISHEHA